MLLTLSFECRTCSLPPSLEDDDVEGFPLGDDIRRGGEAPEGSAAGKVTVSRGDVVSRGGEPEANVDTGDCVT